MIIGADYNGVMRVKNENQLACYFQSNLPKTPLAIRTAICRLEHEMRQAAAVGQLTTAEFPLIHQFEGSKYTRTIFLPKGTFLVGKIHRKAHPFTIWVGHVTVVTEQGGVEEIRGLARGTSPAGVKRAIYVHEDTIWSVVHEVSSTNLEEIEEEVIAPSYTALGWEDPALQYQLTKE